jgi:hypothetical protein
MQHEKIEFPKFNVPGQTNWAKWALFAVGGMVIISTFAFGVALSKRDQAPVAKAEPAKADVPLAPSATPRPAQPATALAATTAPKVETATASDDTASAPAKAASHHPRRSSHGHSGRSLAKAGSSSSPSKSSGKPDAIDELLKRFK